MTETKKKLRGNQYVGEYLIVTVELQLDRASKGERIFIHRELENKIKDYS